ncbi:hypothetical protein Btru_077804 [Bulinus truncatus]|nr:hypothetical protein Btru_077804 [Bulinus truncatus]
MNKDICELRRHTYGNSIDRITVKKLMSRVFQPCRCELIYKSWQVKVQMSHPGRAVECSRCATLGVYLFTG